MALTHLLRSSKIRRGVAVASLILAAGGLALMHSPSTGSPIGSIDTTPGAASFDRAALNASMALSQRAVVGGANSEFFVDLKLAAGANKKSEERAPLSLAVVLDTSGSMAGSKMEDAKRSLLRLLADMRDADEIAIVTYSNSAEILQPLARVGEVRHAVENRVRALQPSGGTNIPAGLRQGRELLVNAGLARVRRIVLISDGLDSGRSTAAALASDAAEHGMTLSSLGIGTDFDESYMSEVARRGHGNFAFINDDGSSSDALTTFLRKELNESASTVAQGIKVVIELPEGVSLVRAIGAEIAQLPEARGNPRRIALSVGSLFAGDERRVTLQLTSNLRTGDSAAFKAVASFRGEGGQTEQAELLVPSTQAPLFVRAVGSQAEADASRNPEIYARAMSALASLVQSEAAEAYARGEREKAEALIDDNLTRLRSAAQAAPIAAAALEEQAKVYRADQSSFRSAAPASVGGKAAAKEASAREFKNLSRDVY